MRFLFKTLFRTAVIGTALAAAVVGGTAMLVGPERVGAMADQVQGQLQLHFDHNIDDPVAMRRQIAEVAKEYPERIRAVRGDLHTLQEEVARLERERAVSQRVVALVDRDLALLVPAVHEAAASGVPKAQLAAVRFGEEVISFRRATAKMREIERTRSAHEARSADAAHNLKYLRTQEERFVELLDELEGEHAQFQAQLVQLNNEVESIARNERLIDMLGQRQQTLDEAGRYDAVSFEHITGTLERKRAEQEAELDQLAAGARAQDYLEIAASQIRSEVGQQPAADFPPQSLADQQVGYELAPVGYTQR
ncbi:hypothetical protein N9Z54_05815 [Planctomycetota bacterium]|nr:hypothetical protein [Planctomycetota bacterium]